MGYETQIGFDERICGPIFPTDEANEAYYGKSWRKILGREKTE